MCQNYIDEKNSMTFNYMKGRIKGRINTSFNPLVIV